MQVEHESESCAFHYDSLMGVGRFERKADGALTYWETGSDCAQLRRDLNRMAQKTGAKKYPKAAPAFGELFDSLASEYTYHNEESDDE